MNLERAGQIGTVTAGTEYYEDFLIDNVLAFHDGTEEMHYQTVISTAAAVYFARMTDLRDSPLVAIKTNVPLEYSFDRQLPDRMINALNPTPEIFL